jgi:YidC/Oxa1 family membrane protein insertase
MSCKIVPLRQSKIQERMDRNQTVGIVLIIGLVLMWSYFTSPSKEEIEANKRVQDSIALVQQEEPGGLESQAGTTADTGDQIFRDTMPAGLASDSLTSDPGAAMVGPFALHQDRAADFHVMENEDFIVRVSPNGAVIAEVELKKYRKIRKEKEGITLDEPVKLLEDEKNKMSWILPYGHPSGNFTRSDQLLYEVDRKSNRELVLVANGKSGQRIKWLFRLNESGYQLQQELMMEGIDRDKTSQEVTFDWNNYLDKIEQNVAYERIYSTVYYKERNEDPDYCSCRSNDQEAIATPLDWVSHANQFFNSTIMPERGFESGQLETVVFEGEEEDIEDLKLLKSLVSLTPPQSESAHYKLQWYIGPNDFENLQTFGKELEMIVPFGWSIFGTINRWVVRPLFNFLMAFVGSQGIAIIILTLLVKFALYPLTYKMLHSQAKMSALKPEIEKMKVKLKDKPQEQQVEMMKLYREFGVNPLGGCMPMVLQMPIWFALYRFFPASLEFRQASFWWAHDLSSYDVIAFLPFEIPFAGSHISLFTLLWSATMLIYAVYNMKYMDMTTAANPMLKYMQYITPVMFIFFFNSYASGLTCYLFFSTLTNILQTVGTKEFVFDDKKIMAQLEKNKSKPKKKSSFAQRLEVAMKEQQKKQKGRSANK